MTKCAQLYVQGGWGEMAWGTNCMYRIRTKRCKNRNITNNNKCTLLYEALNLITGVILLT